MTARPLIPASAPGIPVSAAIRILGIDPGSQRTGIGIIVMVAGQMKKAGGALRVVAANQHVEQLLRMTNVDQIVGLHPTAAVAAATF